ncbi:MAG: hypothetical protein M0Z75_15505 [Nitrospiraceae bacterium]|nr:hypothetical protein [Nitrospiraceae bacterium]
MTFNSILFKKAGESIRKETLEAPACFVDLNLDQIMEAVTEGRQEYNLKPFFYTPLGDVDSIAYRHEIFLDLESQNVFGNIKSFAQRMRAMREHLARAEKLYYKLQKERFFLKAVEIYCDAVTGLDADLALSDLKSHGLVAFREYLADYVGSGPFALLLSETKKLLADLSSIKYSLLIKDNSIKVSNYESGADYSSDVEETFAKFKQGAVKDYIVKFSDSPEMNHVEAKILEFVANLNSGTFSNLADYYLENSSFLDKTIAVFDREIQFYIACLEFIEKFKRAGLKFCYPRISDKSKEVYAYEEFDLALAHKLIGENSPVVCNDFYLKGKERIFVVSGPNQGGKTTFARTFGQLHYLAAIGCPVPGREAQLFLSDNIFTHFEKEEDIENLRGKLQDDLIRVHDILGLATPNSIIIMNEIFTSTTLQDAVFLSKKIMEKIMGLDLLCVWVTFIDELSSFGEQTVSMVSTVVPENPALRTYKIIRRPADGLAYAISLAERHRLTYDHLKDRMKQ